MMLLLAAFALSTASDLDVLDRAVETCARDVVNPAFAAEAKRRSAFMTEVFRDQEDLVAARLDNSNRRRALRETRPSGIRANDNDQMLEMTALAIEDRQRALNDKRMLETLRSDAMDAKRRYFLAHCASTKDPR